MLILMKFRKKLGNELVHLVNINAIINFNKRDFIDIINSNTSFSV